MTTARVSTLLAGLLCLSLAAGASAAPITVAYEITGGTTFGGFLGNAPIQSGTLVVMMPNPASNPPPIQTMNPSLAFRLTATNGLTRFLTELSFPSRSAAYRSDGTSRFYFYGLSVWDHLSTRRYARFTISTGGAIANGSYYWRRFHFYPNSSLNASGGVLNLTGQEVQVPEPSRASLSIVALLALAGFGATARVSRRLSRR
jgi:hypothetical protein